ncbi:Ppx/GppA phosphatase family protein [Aureliella helgolandensis]|uniref:Exopolyphosphatase n=1 Tax=Aureliella helgolandensis TaxID=2527968 RepID=A0A518G2C0_9BACT|nr:Ppx/GppA phosphatase family protein [Aureliella helgolandensis]QDV22767.1 Exopolyphosphatase [Aureliella helgolandensis]
MSSVVARTAIDSVEEKLPVAVIDIGTTSIRMAIAEIDNSGGVHLLENLSQAVTIGKDTFTQRRIRKASIEQCVRVLRSYRRLLLEYGITRPNQIRVIATSAVREAINRLAFMDRVYIATGLEVEPLDEAEVSRITYMGIQPLLQADPKLMSSKSVVVEVGGGSTEVLVVQSGNVLFSHTYRLGSLRLLETLEKFDAPPGKQRAIMESQIQRVVAQIREHVSNDTPLEMVAIGGDVRFAAKNILGEWDSDSLAYLATERLDEFTRKMLQLSEDQIVQRFGVSFQDAETIAPALLTYVLIARGFNQTKVAISDTNLRDGLLQDMATREIWTANFRSQIIRSAIGLGRRFDFDEKHARHVATLCRKLFADLQSEHQLEPRLELVLYVAALLHEIGMYINARSNHKHAMYLIRHSELFGLSRKDVLLVSLVARYHRRSSPMPDHEGYSILDRDQRVAVSKLAAILRLAIALDDSRSQRINDIQCRSDTKRMVLIAKGVEDVSLEQLALRQSGNLFEETFGVPVQIRPTRRPS